VVVADVSPPRVDDGQQPGEKELKRHLKNDSPVSSSASHGGAAHTGEDYQLRTALDYLKAVDIFKASLEPPRGVASKKE
jgi:carboxyl-terminal processing protease